MTFDEWLQMGLDNRWCGPPVCATHDGLPTTAEEADRDEPCFHVVRVYDDESVADAVEANHAPSVWRKLS